MASRTGKLSYAPIGPGSVAPSRYQVPEDSHGIAPTTVNGYRPASAAVDSYRATPVTVDSYRTAESNGHSAPPAPVSTMTPAALAGATMGTTWSARLALPAGVTADAARTVIQDALDRVVAQMSTWDDASDLSRYNRAEPGWQALPDACFHVVQHALQLAADTQGAYDPTIGPIVNAWGFGPPPYASEPPSTGTLQALRQRCGWQRVRLDNETRRAWQPGGVYLDLSSIAKGYGVDVAAQALANAGVANYLVEVGGELRARGCRPDGQPWRVAVEVPDGSDDHALALVLSERSIATSGDYRRYRDGDAGRYAHTIDPRTGRPTANAVASVTVVHEHCMQADALATALTVLGEREGLAYAQRHALAALFILRGDHELRLAASDAFIALAPQ